MKELLRFKIPGGGFQHELLCSVLVKADFKKLIAAHWRHFCDGSVAEGFVMHTLTYGELRKGNGRDSVRRPRYGFSGSQP